MTKKKLGGVRAGIPSLPVPNHRRQTPSAGSTRMHVGPNESHKPEVCSDGGEDDTLDYEAIIWLEPLRDHASCLSFIAGDDVMFLTVSPVVFKQIVALIFLHQGAHILVVEGNLVNLFTVAWLMKHFAQIPILYFIFHTIQHESATKSLPA